MQIVRARILGMCMGVRRADELAHRAAEKAAQTGRPVYSYGPLIHNPQAVADLESLGVRVLEPSAIESELDELPNLKDAIVIIRAHGASLAALSRLHVLGARVVDATCPRVIKSQGLARHYERLGWQIVLIGDPRHGEISGILGHTLNALVVDSPETALPMARALRDKPCALIAQTTIRQEDYDAIINIFQSYVKKMIAEKTICPATRERQQALAELSTQVDAVLVVGGKNSENTKRLYKTAIGFGLPSWHIETASELTPEMMRYNRIGITAGASTPDFIVDEIQEMLVRMAQSE